MGDIVSYCYIPLTVSEDFKVITAINLQLIDCKGYLKKIHPFQSQSDDARRKYYFTLPFSLSFLCCILAT